MDGVVDASITLTGVVERVNGTFVPCSQPIIAGFRVYLLTQFVPTDMTSQGAPESLGMQRLYAFDLRARLMDRIHTVWFYNLEMEGRRSQQTRTTGSDPGIIPPIVMYYQGVIYINNVGPQASRRFSGRDKQPYASTLWAFRDNGNDTQLLFKKSCWYGPMAMYDTYNDLAQSQKRGDSSEPLFSARGRVKEHRLEEDAVIWVLNRSPALIAGHSARDGSVIGQLNLAGVSKIEGWATSKMGVTRLFANSTKDIIVIGMQNSDGEAFLVAVEVDRKAPNNASLVFSTKVGSADLLHRMNSRQEKHSRDKQGKEGPRNAKPHVKSVGTHTQHLASTMYSVAGQIVNVAIPAEKRKASNRARGLQGISKWKLGVVALVEESGPSYSKLHAAAVF
ncbi:hypothetical protein RRG08_016974 [Elysia crispata]|uniref:Uncharacterized protein n=1 Tax=Elysia crispata TaxID=231223 RepID=A0AAE1CPJ3_9GAST|nr:hypothetical protein RRG08_016974 [Elysia crispata]